MKRKTLLLVITVLLAMIMAVPTFANSYSGGTGWNVTFTENEKLVSNFTSEEMADVLMGLQPGDDATFRAQIQNSNSANTRWYMSNQILQSLEDSSQNTATAGGAYTYRLYYFDKNGQRHTLFDSDEVGGDTVSQAGRGLNEATSALKDFFYLDEFSNGQGGTVELFVGLDGETQNNDYQDTLAELQLNFAVELMESSNESETRRNSGLRDVVKTGDTNNPLIYFILIGISGIVLLGGGITLFILKRRKN